MSDQFTKEDLISLLEAYKTFAKVFKEKENKLGISLRCQGFPESISENIIKFIIINHEKQPCTWNCKSGDLHSSTLGKIECKCFTSTGPLSFGPKSTWDALYFLDATKWLDDKYILYKINLKNTDDLWQNLKVNATETFINHCIEKRRPRIKWNQVANQLPNDYKKIFDGTIVDIFTQKKD